MKNYSVFLKKGRMQHLLSQLCAYDNLSVQSVAQGHGPFCPLNVKKNSKNAVIIHQYIQYRIHCDV